MVKNEGLGNLLLSPHILANTTTQHTTFRSSSVVLLNLTLNQLILYQIIIINEV